MGKRTNGLHGLAKPKPCAAYDDEGVCIAVGDSVQDLARQLKITASSISHSIRNGGKRYAYILSDEEIEQLEKHSPAR